MTTLSKPIPKKPQLGTVRKTLVFIIVVVLVSWGLQGLNYKGIMPSAAGTITGMWNGIVHPDVDYLTNWTIDGLPYAIVETIAIAISGTFVSGVLAIPFALIASQNIVGKRVSKVGKFIITMIRTFRN